MLDTTLLDTGILEAVAMSPSVQGTVVLLLISIALQWYMNQPPRPKFPEAELDETDWHGSLMKAKTKVCYALKPRSLSLPLSPVLICT